MDRFPHAYTELGRCTELEVQHACNSAAVIAELEPNVEACLSQWVEDIIDEASHDAGVYGSDNWDVSMADALRAICRAAERRLAELT